MKLTKIALAVCGAASFFAAGSASAAAFPDFGVNAISYINPALLAIPGFGQFTADKMTGNYVEVVSFDGMGNFAVSLKWNAGQFVSNDGSSPVANTGLNVGGGLGYGIYATLMGVGTVSTDITGKSTITLTSGNVALFVDDAENTTFAQPAAGNLAFTLGNTGDDKQLGSGTVLSGQGTLDPNLATCVGGGINCGSFGQTTSFSLTNPAGPSFFVTPSPFYNLSFQSGQLNNFTPTGTVVINGSLDVVFANAVPEPGSLALVGLALAGVGFARRRKG